MLIDWLLSRQRIARYLFDSFRQPANLKKVLQARMRAPAVWQTTHAGVQADQLRNPSLFHHSAGNCPSQAANSAA